MNTLTKQPNRVEKMDPETGELELIEQFDPNEAGALTVMAEVNAQVATARRFPRRRAKDISLAIEGLATMTEEIAEECMYSLPRGGKVIEGPSIRFAEIVQQQWGNNRVAAEVGGIDRVNKRIFATGYYHDLETNSATKVTIHQRISGSDKKGGQIFNDDMIAVAGSAASSKARRNAILAGVPRAVWHRGYESVRQVLMGDIKTLANRRAAAITAFQRFGITPDQIFGLLAVKDENDITLEHLVTLRGTLSGLKSGEITVEQLFRQDPGGGEAQQPKDVSQPAKTTTDALNTFGSGGATNAQENGAIVIDRTNEKPAGEGQPSQTSMSATTETVAASVTTQAASETVSPAGDASQEGGKKGGATQPESERVTTTQAESVGRVDTADQTYAEEKREPTEAEKALKVAKEQGETARQHGTRRSAVPGDYRKNKELADAWLAGWDGPLGSK